MTRRLMFFIVPVLALLLATPVYAITYGQPDGSKHPNVGALVGTFNGETYPYCSGALISSTVVLTAAHCDVSAETGSNSVLVTFDSVYSANSTTYRGTFYADPKFNQQQDDPHDIAAIVLDTPVSGIIPAKVPSLGQFNSLVKDQKFTAVGYGGEEPVNEPGGPVIAHQEARQYAVSTLNAVNPAWLRLSQNQAKGDGGTCYGDSGGPNFFGADAGETQTIAGITITGDSLCKATNVIYRLDSSSAQQFLAPFLKSATPEASAPSAKTKPKKTDDGVTAPTAGKGNKADKGNKSDKGRKDRNGGKRHRDRQR